MICRPCSKLEAVQEECVNGSDEEDDDEDDNEVSIARAEAGEEDSMDYSEEPPSPAQPELVWGSKAWIQAVGGIEEIQRIAALHRTHVSDDSSTEDPKKKCQHTLRLASGGLKRRGLLTKTLSISLLKIAHFQVRITFWASLKLSSTLNPLTTSALT